MTSGAQSRLGVIPGEGVKAPCDTIAATNITLSGFQTVGGVALTLTTERVIVAGQTDTTENGIYNPNSSTWTRTFDFDASNDVHKGQLVSNSASGTVYIITAPANWVAGTGVVILNV